MHTAIQFRVRDKRTWQFTRTRPWNRPGDVKQHLAHLSKDELCHYEVVESIEIETRTLGAEDMLNGTGVVKRPLTEAEIKTLQVLVENAGD